MKKFSLLLSIILLIGLMIPSTYATSNMCQESEIIHTEFGDFELETITFIYSSESRSNGKSADRVYTVKQSGKTIAEITLSATFGYDGKTAWVSSASGSHVTYDNWSYGSERITKSGGTASLSAKLTHSRYEDIPIKMSMTCSPTGQIS